MNNQVVIIDNNDSFTYNLAQYLKYLNQIPVILNINELPNFDFNNFDKIIISPGPKLPQDYPDLIYFIDRYKADKKILGVCLGHQALAISFGGNLYNLNKPRHGEPQNLNIVSNDENIYFDIDDKTVGLYHSWAVRDDLPNCLEVTAYDDTGVIMSIRHIKYNICGVQYHPESIITKSGLKILKNWLYC